MGTPPWCRRRVVVPAVLALLLGLAGCDSGTAPATPTTIQLRTPGAASGTVGTTVAGPVVEVLDADGRAVSGVRLTLAASDGGSTSAAVVTSKRGPTATGTWTLGTRRGTQRLTITAAGLPALEVVIDAVAGAPATMVRVGSDLPIEGAPGSIAPIQPTVLVRDAFGNAVPDVVVSVEVTGGGSVQVAAPRTSSAGEASVGAWTFSGAGGPQSVVFRVPGLPAVTFSAVVRPPFAITIRYIGTVSAAVQAAVQAAAARISQFIVESETPVVYANFDYATQCDLPGAPVVDEIIDDLLIFVTVRPIDVPGGVLAQAGPCEARLPSYHPTIGDIILDVADVPMLEASDVLVSTVLHEMLHVVGVGTVWGTGLQNLLAAQGTSTVSFAGARARAAYLSIGGAAALPGVPVENTGGTGTADSHWRESVFGRELMTGFLNPGVANPLSVVTIAALGDMGYGVDLTRADAFSLVAPGSILGDTPVVVGYDVVRPLRALRTVSGARLSGFRGEFR